MNAVCPFGIVIGVLFVKYFGHNRQCTIIIAHNSIQDNFCNLTTLTVICIHKPQILDRFSQRRIWRFAIKIIPIFGR